jgi:enterochelin esterase-like enzyme
MYTEVNHDSFYSVTLRRNIKYDVFMPKDLAEDTIYPLLLLNDGQESTPVKVKHNMEQLTEKGITTPFICVGIHAHERIQEYGVAHKADYAGRGAKAGDYAHFILNEFLPMLEHTLPIMLKSEKNYFAGYSLGGLSAFDIVWHNPDYFGGVGCFSGSFWWREKKWLPGVDVDNSRIAHAMVRKTKSPPTHLNFWFQAGTNDETNDRNNNGIIDAIDDTLDLILELNKQGIRSWEKIFYHEIEGGEHHPKTWAQAMKAFMSFAFKTL